jgi:YihY family inner membrane protein
MTVKDVRLLIDKSVNAWVDDYAPSMGAALAFYTLFSIAPLFIFIIALAGFIFGPDAAQGEIVAQLRGRIGVDAAAVVQSLIKSVSRPTEGVIATVVSILTLFIGATSVFSEVQSALNRIWRMPDPASGSILSNLVRTRLLSFGMVLGLGLLLVLSLAFSTFLSAMGRWSNGWISGWQTLLQVANFILSFAINAVIFAMIYKVMPRARIAWRDVAVGAMVTALLFETSKLLIGLYLGRSTVTSGFGAAGSLVLFLLWVYLSAQIFLLGAEFTWVYSHQHGSRSERFSTKVVPLVPSRSGDSTPEAKKAVILDRRTAYPLTERYASAAGRFIRRKPLLSFSVLAAIGVATTILVSRSGDATRGSPRSPRPSSDD